MTSTPHTISTTSTIFAYADKTRTSLTIFNTHASAICYIKEGREASSANGIPILPSSYVAISELEDGVEVKEQWAIISDTATTLIRVFEGHKP